VLQMSTGEKPDTIEDIGFLKQLPPPRNPDAAAGGQEDPSEDPLDKT